MILFVDDEPPKARDYRDELEESGYDVKFCHSVDAGLNFLKENQEKVDLLILDIMMSPGEQLKDAPTRYGLRTGVFFFEKARQISSSLKIILLTNVDDPAIADKFNRKPKCLFLRKENTEPDELVAKVKSWGII